MSCTNSHPILWTFSSEYSTLGIYESSFGNRGNISQSIFIVSLFNRSALIITKKKLSQFCIFYFSAKVPYDSMDNCNS